MRHKNSRRKFGIDSSHRRAMFRSLATSLLNAERIETTLPRAKDLRRVVERLITLAANDSLHARRMAYAYLFDKRVVHKLFADIGPRFKGRKGGYTRVVRSRIRHGDAAQLAVIELVERSAAAEQSKGSAAKATGKKSAKKAAEAGAAAANEEADTQPKKAAAKPKTKAAKPAKSSSGKAKTKSGSTKKAKSAE